MELTDKEKMMMSEGIIFSTSKPIPMFIKDGMDGGNYVCNAFANAREIQLLIYDMNLTTESQLITINGKEVEYVSIDSYIVFENQEPSYRKSINSYLALCFKEIGGVFCDGAEGYGWKQSYSLKSDKYEGLSLDTQAKRFFIDILKVYLEETRSVSSSDVEIQEIIENENIEP